MKCIVTAGPTYEPLDDVRRLTNFSTGKLGTELANRLAQRGHEVLLLRGVQATFSGEVLAQAFRQFSTTEDLKQRLEEAAGDGIQGVFHAAAVSDFAFGAIWHQRGDGQLVPARSRKISTRDGPLLAELLPTPKLIGSLRQWFPRACVVGWKYETDGSQAGAVAKANRQITIHRIQATVVNGPAYGAGYGLITKDAGCQHWSEAAALYDALEALMRSSGSP